MEKTNIIPERQEYTLERIRAEGLERFFFDFQGNFMDYAEISLEIGRRVFDLKDSENGHELLMECLKKENSTKFPNFNRYIGDLERACNAAQTIGKEYDLGIGLAKKGSWLSYVFRLHDYKTRDLIVIRIGEDRLIHILSPLVKNDVKGKKILLYDNDLVTGDSVKSVTEAMLSRGANKVDLLLVYKNTRLLKYFYEQVKSKFKGNPKKIGKTAAGEIVLDTTCEVPSAINRALALETDFEADRKYVDFLIHKLYGGK